MQSKTRLKISLNERSILMGISAQQDKVVPVPKYIIQKTVTEYDSTSRTMTRKGMQDIGRENPAYADPF